MMALEVTFGERIILEGHPDENYLSLTVNDDLSALLEFRTAARGDVEL
jgi:hypothetical protein